MLILPWDAPEVAAAKQKVNQRRKMLAFSEKLGALEIQAERSGMSRNEMALVLCQHAVSIKQEK